MIYEYWLASLYKIDCNRRRQAVAAAGSAEALYRMPEKELRGLHLFSETEEALFLESRREADPEGAYEKFQRSGIGFLPITDPRYPEKLRQIYDPPFALYVKGRIPDGAKRSVAVVGARQCSEYGAQHCREAGKSPGGPSGAGDQRHGGRHRQRRARRGAVGRRNNVCRAGLRL